MKGGDRFANCCRAKLMADQDLTEWKTMGEIVEWNHLPRHDENLPQYPDWCEFQKDGRRYWATRFESEAIGVDIGPVSTVTGEAGSNDQSHRQHVEIVVIDPEDEWTGCVIHEDSTETTEEANCKAAEFRESLDTYIMLKRL